jgi:hypothetical protein
MDPITLFITVLMQRSVKAPTDVVSDVSSANRRSRVSSVSRQIPWPLANVIGAAPPLFRCWRYGHVLVVVRIYADHDIPWQPHTVVAEQPARMTQLSEDGSVGS